MNDPNLKEALQKTQEQIETRVIDEPDPWGPLHKHVPKEWHGGFMFMGSVDHPHWGRVWYYKHGMTRKYLRIDQAGNFYREMEDPITKEFVLAQLADRNPAFDDVFKDIEKFGATRETSYDAGYKCRRDQALVEAGYTVASVSPEGVTEKRKWGEVEYGGNVLTPKPRKFMAYNTKAKDWVRWLGYTGTKEEMEIRLREHYNAPSHVVAMEVIEK